MVSALRHGKKCWMNSHNEIEIFEWYEAALTENWEYDGVSWHRLSFEGEASGEGSRNT